jgi:hypothetical protein
LHECAINSFSHFHPEINTFSYDYQYQLTDKLQKIPIGIARLYLAYSIFRDENLDKLIILGADTITCSRLNEFIDENNFDILTTLDYPYRLIAQNKIFSKDDEDHVNADVVCYNNINALKEVIEKSMEIPTEYYEQAGLNFVCNMQNKFTSKIVDGNYESSNVVYNARAKGNICAKPGEKPWFKYTNLFKVRENKLFTNTHENCSKSKQIKLWHYCDGLGTVNDFQFQMLINNWINKGFNEETKKFFTDQCACGDFFNKQFII